MKYMWKLFCFGGILTLLFCNTNQSSIDFIDRTVSISLRNGSVSNPVAYSNQYKLLANETWLLSITDLQKDAHLAIVQAHSYAYNVTLSYTQNLTRPQFVTGTNIGLNLKSDGNLYLFNSGPYVNVSVMIVVTIYPKTAPIPGGCNMEFETIEAPYVKLIDQISIIKAEIAPALVSDTKCGVPKITYDMYHYFLPSQDFTKETYFESLQNMMTPNDIYEYGTRSIQRINPAVRRLYSAFVGNGVVYVAVATIANTSYQASYIPTLTYSCSIVYSDGSCDVLQTAISKVLCAVIFFVGLLLCTVGHRCFRVQMFLTGAVLFGLLTYLAGATMNLSYTGLMWLTVFGCALGGAAWWRAWGVCGRPVLAVMAAGLVIGYLAAGVITTYPPDSLVSLLQSDSLYYASFGGITVLAALVVSCSLCWGSVPASAVLGSLAMTFPLDYYLGGHFQYVVINSVRRVTVPDFKYAVATPPFQAVDWWLSALRVIIAVVSAYFQWRRAKGHAPFPPNNVRRRPRSFRPRRYWTCDSDVSSRPLLADTSGMSYGSDSVFLS